MRDLAPSERAYLRAGVHWLVEQHGKQATAARASGVMQSTLATYGSHGERSWKVSEITLAKLAAACGVEPDALLAGKGPKPSDAYRERCRVHQVRAGAVAGR
jgi:hypothetical protein